MLSQFGPFLGKTWSMKLFALTIAIVRKSRFPIVTSKKTLKIVVGAFLLLLKKHLKKSLTTIAYKLNIEYSRFDYFTLRPGLIMRHAHVELSYNAKAQV